MPSHSRRIKACKACGHGSAIHNRKKIAAGIGCNYPGCNCRNYIEPPISKRKAPHS